MEDIQTVQQKKFKRDDRRQVFPVIFPSLLPSRPFYIGKLLLFLLLLVFWLSLLAFPFYFSSLSRIVNIYRAERELSTLYYAVILYSCKIIVYIHLAFFFQMSAFPSTVYNTWLSILKCKQKRIC